MLKRSWQSAYLAVLLVCLSGFSVSSATPPPPDRALPPGGEQPLHTTTEGFILTLEHGERHVNQQTELVPAQMEEDFEGAWPAPGWVVVDQSNTDGGEYRWGRRDCHPRTGDFAGWSAGGGVEGSSLPCGADYPNNAETWAVYGPFTLRDATSAALTFHMWGRTAPSNAPWPDGLYVGSSIDGSQFLLQLHRGDITGGDEGNGYHRWTVDLSDRLGEDQVWIAFGFISDSTGTDNGMMIDDVTLTASGLSPSFPLGWSSMPQGDSYSVAWGDMDRDGHLELAVANGDEPTRVYRNENGTLRPEPAWAAGHADQSRSVAWGDYDGDGDLDLAVGNEDQPNRLYRNEDGTLSDEPVWSSAESDSTVALAWGDVDGDGDLDLAVGNRWEQPVRLYRNNGGTLSHAAVWSSAEINYAQSIAWGDYDDDGDLDLAVGNFHLEPNRLYRNDGGSLTGSAIWESSETDHTYAVSWADYDGDGDLDLAAANGVVAGFYLDGVPNRLYQNDGGVLSSDAVWSSQEADDTRSAAWGDFDVDGDPDLAVSNTDGVRLYRNDGGVLTSAAAWSAEETNYGEEVAWGDADGDGDLDLAVANWAQPNRVYLNDGQPLGRRSAWVSAGEDDTLSVAWGDVDEDGDFDLATGNRGPNRLYGNAGGTLLTSATWTSTPTEWANSVAWGDVDGDGDLDLAVGNGGHAAGDPNALYRNDGGSLNPAPIWTGSEVAWTNGVAWGDYDGDGDLDLAVGNDGAPNHIYRNTGGTLTASPVWSSDEADNTSSIAWGDVDGDGDLDLAVGNGSWQGDQPNRVYTNREGDLSRTASWSSHETDDTRSVAWGDVDGDGDLDLVAGNRGPNRLYENSGGKLNPDAVWSSNEADATNSIAWGDCDGDGDLDLAVGNYWNEPNRLYRNDAGLLTANAIWSSAELEHTSSVAWGDVDNDGDIDLVAGNEMDQLAISSQPNRRIYRNTRDNFLDRSTVPVVAIADDGAPGDADFYSSPEVWADGTVAVSYALFHPDSDPVHEIQGYYSLDGGGSWHPAVPAPGTVTRDLASAPHPAVTASNSHVYTWDVLASGVMGQYDNVVFRLVAVPALTHRANDGAGPYHYGAHAATSLPFRVRGNQVRVLNGTEPVPGALVYRLASGQAGGGQPYADAEGNPFRTDALGYLKGHGEIAVGDRLLALAPITGTSSYTLYHTSGAPTPTGVDADTVSDQGVQTLQVSEDYPLIRFHLDVSLEWDAHEDDVFLEKLEYDLRRTADHFYDFTDGQATLGEVYIFHDAENWQTAHMRIYATNRLRPNAAQGGVVAEGVSDKDVAELLYQPGQIRMPPTWNRYGDPSAGGIGEDWPRTLAHEMGHYCLFLDDHYLGFDESGQVVSVDSCTDTAMTDPYRYTEFRDQAGWLPPCEDTLANHFTGRSDWETISTFYPVLTGPDDRGFNSGPTLTPFDFTEIAFFDPLTPTPTIPDPTYYFLNEAGQRYEPSDGARGFLIKDETWLVDVGEPLIDHILARGAGPGDRLCVFDATRSRSGCETLAAGDDQIVLHSFPDWKPQIFVSPVSTNAVSLEVQTDASLDLRGRVFSTDGPATEVFILAETESGVYEAQITATIEEELLLEGFAHVWVDEATPRRESIIDYSIGASPGAVRGLGGAVRGLGGVIRGHGGAVRGLGGAVRGLGAPILSGDGQLTIHTPDPVIPDGEFLTIQAVRTLPELPAGRVQVGQGYRIAATPGLSNLNESSISFQYRGEAVPAGMEEDITIHYWNTAEATWQALPTNLDTWDNFASASVESSGLYVLLTSFRVDLPRAGWNLFSYPLRDPQPVEAALRSIESYYTTVYGYASEDVTDPWKVHDVDAPAYVNDLEQLQYGHGYWISVTQPITAHFGVGPDQTADLATSIPPQVPATYYGTVTGGLPGQDVTAWIGDTLCGQSHVQQVRGQSVYAINVAAEAGGPSGCGTPGREITFVVGSETIDGTAAWDDGRPRRFPLYVGEPNFRLYLPGVLKER